MAVNAGTLSSAATKCISDVPGLVKHTFTPPASGGSIEARIRSIQAYHMDTRGWCDIGYHFLVAGDGQVFEGRPYALLGAHTGGQNSGNIGVSFIGCFHPAVCAAMPPSRLKSRSNPALARNSAT